MKNLFYCHFIGIKKMNINLTYIIARKKDNLASFLKKNNLLSYEQLLYFCKERGLNPCSEKDFNENAYIESKNPVKENVKKIEPEKQNKARKPRSTQKKKTVRRNTKKKQDTPKLSNSSNSKKD